MRFFFNFVNIVTRLSILAFDIVIFVGPSPRMLPYARYVNVNLCAFDIFFKVIADILKKSVLS